MKPFQFSAWLRAIRPFSFTGALVPVFLGTLIASQSGKFSLVSLILTTVAVLLLQAGVNLNSDFDDFTNKVDVVGSYGSSGVILSGALSPKAVKTGGLILIGVGAILGITLAAFRGWEALILGIIGAAIGYSYTSKPFELKYRGLGAIAVFLVYGPLLALGAFFIQSQTLDLVAIWISIPAGLLTTAILHSNDIRDMDFDRQAGIHTFSLLVGRRGANLFYASLIFGAYLALVGLVLTGIFPLWSLLALGTLPLAIQLTTKTGTGDTSVAKILTLDQETGKLHTVFSAIVLATMVLAHYFPARLQF